MSILFSFRLGNGRKDGFRRELKGENKRTCVSLVGSNKASLREKAGAYRSVASGGKIYRFSDFLFFAI
jgi:hypothetical protein